MKLEGRTAIVTGAAQGIGCAIARKLDAEGAQLVLADINGDGVHAVASELRDAVGIRTDTSSPEDVQALVDATIDRAGKVDVLVNCAAIVPFVSWDDVTFEEWRRIMAVNLDGVFLTCRAVDRHMREAEYGRIVNIASNSILAGTPNMAHYVASKGGVFSFTRALARELGKYGITVNSVAPGLTASEGVMASPHAGAFDFVQMLQCIPRRGESEDIAPTVAFLASEEGGWVTGQMIAVDGGQHLIWKTADVGAEQ
jgi:NAD(P)-dependent dehydrogenase (short-subunit alcohol dehydrogenase family)